MKSYKAKDLILNQLIIKKYHSDCEYLAGLLGLPFETIYALVKDMEDRKHVETTSTATIGHPRSLCITLTPQGEHFIKNGGYTKEAWKINWTSVAGWVVAVSTATLVVLELLKLYKK